jgi:hypothetical protein
LLKKPAEFQRVFLCLFAGDDDEGIAGRGPAAAITLVSVVAGSVAEIATSVGLLLPPTFCVLLARRTTKPIQQTEARRHQ